MIVTLLVVLVAFSPWTNADTTRFSFEKNNPHPNAKYFDNSRIVGGVDAPAGLGEHMASLLYGYQWMMFICGGSIIGPRTILTAAHCIDSMRTGNMLLQTFRAAIGSYRWDSGSDREFNGHVIHPGWSWNTIKNDIGLLRVSKDMHPSNTVAFMPISFNQVGGGLSCYVTGWGLQSDSSGFTPNRLQMLNVTTLTHDDCTRRMKQATDPGEIMPAISPYVEICALHSYGHGMCNGDSGSGLIDAKRKLLVGIVSWGKPCAKGAPDVYARASAFKDWLKSHGVA